MTMQMLRKPEEFTAIGQDNLPGLLGIVFTETSKACVKAEMAVRKNLMAPNGFLHAGSLVSLADTCAGYGCVLNLPEGGVGFTTIELKSNHLSTAREGMVDCVATPVHVGRSTQVWDCTVSHRETAKTMALFRCTQMVLFAKA
jgi:1,4-dihydroxy-2-naphthoyl-CoA hydrolase